MSITETNNSVIDRTKILKCIEFKDSHNISDEKWINLRKLLIGLEFDGLTPLCGIRNKITSINEKSVIKRNDYGVYNDLVPKLKLDLSEVVRRLNIPSDIPLRLKFCADGAYVNKMTSVLNFGFSCLNDSERCKSANGHSLLGIFEIEKESHEGLSFCLRESFDEIARLRSLDINSNRYLVITYLGGDLKFLAAFMGIKAATSNYPCIFCKAHKNEFGDLQKEFSVVDVNKKARTISDSETILKSNIPDKFGYASVPVS